MLLTCDKCSARYRLDPAKLAGGGRMVRCTKCGHTWFFTSPEEQPREIVEDLPQETDFEFSVESFHTMLAEHQVSDAALPSVAKPMADIDMPVLDHQPGGMGAAAFGVCTFLLLLFPTLLGLFLMRGAIVPLVPAMASIYKPLGMHVEAPGEGLRFSALTARTRTEGEEQSLDLSMKLSNISETAMHYPSVKVTLFGVYGAPLKDWEFHPEKKELDAGETIPVQLSFDKMPKDGKSVEVRVMGH